MPSFSVSQAAGGGGGGPTATDAYSALLSRLPQWAEESMAARREDAALKRKLAQRGMALEEGKFAAELSEKQEAKAEKRRAEAQARQDASQERYRQQMKEAGMRRNRRAKAADMARTYGGSAAAAAQGADVEFDKMMMGVPGAY